MHRSDWLLLFLTAGLGGALDPVRVQKGMFLLAMHGCLPDRERYDFEPYAYGPMSRRLYRDVRRLSDAGLLTRTPVPGATWELLQATAGGAARSAELRERARPDALRAAAEIRGQISALSFAELLEFVYERHPDYAVRSVFRRSR